MYKKILTYLLLFFFSFQAYSWSREGHRYTGIIAYQLLPEQTRDKVIQELKEHPEFESHFLKLMPEEVKNGSQQLQDMWLFSQMAFWPDLIKYRNYKPKHRNWHYVNLPIYLEKEDSLELHKNYAGQFSFSYDTDKKDDWNVIQGLLYNDAVLQGSEQDSKAISLCWQFHLIGDIHQPLHASGLFDVERFKEGDKGGNLTRVYAVGKLHWFMDGAPAPKRAFDMTFTEHVQFTSLLLREWKDSLNSFTIDFSKNSFQNWIEESHEIAKEDIYTEEILKLVRSAPEKQYSWDNPLLIHVENHNTLKGTYRTLARQRLVLAGMRLAKYLEAIYM